STGATTNGNISLFGFVDNVGAGANIGTSQAVATGISIQAAATGIGINLAGTGISIQNTGGGGAHQNMPPTRICNFIMRILYSLRLSSPAGLITQVGFIRLAHSKRSNSGLPEFEWSIVLRKKMDCRAISAFTRVFNALCPAMTAERPV